MMANVGLNGAGVFYNALLPHMGDESEMDAISNKAFAAGYLGGGLLLVVHLAMVMTLDGGWVIPFAMATSGIWWLGFAQMTFRMVPEPHIENEMEPMGMVATTKMALGEVKATLSDIKSFRTLFFYMLAYFCFIDGINSVTALAGVFGIVVLGLTTTGLILTILIIQFVAAPAAIGFTKLAEKWGTKGPCSFHSSAGASSSSEPCRLLRWNSRITMRVRHAVHVQRRDRDVRRHRPRRREPHRCPPRRR